MTIPASSHVGRLRVETRHLPSSEGGGGDIHDAAATPFGIRLLIGDVMGTGLPAHGTGLSVLNAWRELAYTEPSLADIAARLDTVIAGSEHPERFVTALLVTFPDIFGSPDGSWAELVCCGHPPPLLLREGSAAFIELSVAPPLGMLDMTDQVCRPSMIPVTEGDRLLLYTDGVSEARDPAGRFFPLAERAGLAEPAGLAERAGLGGGGVGASGAELLDGLMADLGDHVGDRVADDILLLLVTVRLAGLLFTVMLTGCWSR
jgi:serine phosphatase RsbU (regulator of sigma subunit)